jgi:hypothetical protein
MHLIYVYYNCTSLKVRKNKGITVQYCTVIEKRYSMLCASWRRSHHFEEDFKSVPSSNKEEVESESSHISVEWKGLSFFCEKIHATVQ